MTKREQLEFPGVIAARTWTRTHPGETRERGRHYERNKVCPVCFRPFTPKGIAQHVASCRGKAELAQDLLGDK